MYSEEDKETKDEESELDDEIIKKLDELKLSEIHGFKFNKENCVKNNLLKETEDCKLYSNLYPIQFTKDIEICEYPFIIKPECHEESVILKILRETSPEIFKKYGYYYRSGNSFFAVRKVNKKNIFKVVIHDSRWLQYIVTVEPFAKISKIKEGQKGGLKDF